MGKKPALRHRYCIKMQGLFSGVEWTILRDGRTLFSGEAPDVEAGLAAARRCYRRRCVELERKEMEERRYAQN